MRLIDADALVDKLKNLNWINDDLDNDTNCLEDIIYNQPTIRTAPLVTRYHETINYFDEDGYEQWSDIYKCPVCDHFVSEKDHFCSHCGAQFKEGATEI